MGKRSKNDGKGEGQETLGELIHEAVRRSIEAALDSELTAALGALRYQRQDGRSGYRNGTRTRSLGGPTGQMQLTVPRGLLRVGDETKEWRSTILPRYERRTTEVNEAILGAYVSGANTRRIKGALKPLLKGVPLSGSTVSRIAGQLKADLTAWRLQRLDELEVVHMFLDALQVKVRRAGRVVSSAVLVALVVLVDGTRRVVMFDMSATESYEGWKGALQKLVTRGLRAPVLCIVDGHPGLRSAIGEVWPHSAVQRCTIHKQRNLLAAAPVHAHGELLADYHAVVYAASAAEAQREAAAFRAKWKKKCAAVADSFDEAGAELLTFFTLPPQQWKALRTTNAIERLNEELRRRVKTQGAHPDEETVVALLYGLVASGQIRLRKMDGHDTLPLALLAHTRARQSPPTTHQEAGA